MNKILILSRYKNHSKNFLIFLPLLISNKSLNISFIDLVIPFCIFIIIASVIYVTNDFLDYNIDVNNKLKKNFLIKEVSFFKIFIFNIFLYLFILFLYFTKYFGYSLVFYVLIFYLYNFFLKKIKYLDITCLFIVTFLKA
jgi:4-hydroxybenzoate polyprenyltransferase